MASVLVAPLLVVVAVYLGFTAWLWWNQERLIFFPVPLAAEHRLATEPDLHELTVPVAGAQLSVLHLRQAQRRGLVFFLHGNAGNLASWFPDTAPYRRAGFDLVMPDYRGFGKSTGRIESEEQLLADVRAVWDVVAERYADVPVVMYGRSLGSALAAGLAADLTREGRAPAVTVLVSPFTRAADLIGDAYPSVPSFVLRYQLDTAQGLSGLSTPVVLVHGSRDEVVPVLHSKRLATKFPEARLVVVEGAGHQDIHRFPAYQEEMQRWFGMAAERRQH